MAEKKNGDILYADDFNGKQDKFGTVSYASSPKYLMLNINGYVDPTSGKFIQLSPSDITSTHINVTNAEISGKVKFDNSLIIGNVGVLGFDFELPTTTTPGKIKTGHPSINKLNFSNGSGTSDIQLGGIKVPTADNDAANKKYVDDNSGAGKKFGTSEVFNDYENNKTYLCDGVRVTNVASTTNSSTFTLESVAGLAVGGTFKLYTDVFHLLMNDTFTIAAVDSINKTITTTTKYSLNTENLYIVNSTATDTVSLFAYCAHAEGNETTATGVGSHAEGFSSKAAGDYSHAEGASNTASGNSSHAEGDISIASGEDSHAEGYQTTASGSHSHAQNYRTTAGYDNQTTMGMYNINKSTTLLEVGNGSTEANSNAFEIYRDGHAEVQIMGTTDNSVAIKKYVDDKIAELTAKIEALSK